MILYIRHILDTHSTKNQINIINKQNTCKLYHFQQYFDNIEVGFIFGEGNQSFQRQAPTSHKSMTKFITLERVELNNLVDIGTHYIGRGKYDYPTLLTMVSPCVEGLQSDYDSFVI